MLLVILSFFLNADSAAFALETNCDCPAPSSECVKAKVITETNEGHLCYLEFSVGDRRVAVKIIQNENDTGCPGPGTEIKGILNVGCACGGVERPTTTFTMKSPAECLEAAKKNAEDARFYKAAQIVIEKIRVKPSRYREHPSQFSRVLRESFASCLHPLFQSKSLDPDKTFRCKLKYRMKRNKTDSSKATVMNLKIQQMDPELPPSLLACFEKKYEDLLVRKMPRHVEIEASIRFGAPR